MEILGRIRGFAFNPAKEFAAAKKDTLMDAFKYYILLLAVLAAILAIVMAVAVSVVESMVERLNRESGLTVLTVTHKEPKPGLITPLLLKVAEGQVMEVTWNMDS